jgi:hypothetical protein
MKSSGATFVEDRPYAKPEAAARRLLEIANATEADQGKERAQFSPR